MPLRVLKVRNNEPNVTVFAKVVDGNNHKINWGAKGEFNDTQRVPEDFAHDIDFLNALEQGTLTVVDGPEDLVKELQFNTDQVRQEKQEQEARLLESLDRRQDRDIVSLTCIGPTSPGRSGMCGRPVLQHAKTSTDIPPLCSQHEHLAPTFHLVETGSKGEGATESKPGVVRREWKPLTMTAPISTNV